MIITEAKELLPRPIRRLLNFARRLPYLWTILGGRPIEPAVRQIYSQYITGQDVVIEVGARMGDGTRTLADIARHVYSFEPSRTNFAVLRTLTRTHRNVDVYNLALSDRVAEEYLYRDRSFSGVASLKRLSHVNYVAREKVEVATLNGMDFKSKPTVLVVDCEGAEYEVLKGGENLLPCLRTVLVETHVLSDGTSTTPAVQEELGRFFPSVSVETVGYENWVLAKR